MKEYIEMKWRRSGETVRVYNFSTFDRKINGSYNHEIVSYATIFSKIGKRCGGSGWQTVDVHELTPLDCFDENNIYEHYDACAEDM